MIKRDVLIQLRTWASRSNRKGSGFVAVFLRRCTFIKGTAENMGSTCREKNLQNPALI
jgi:hypothetical protein